MKTLIINGSPRKNGDTAALINILCESLHGEYRTVSAYYDNISPCLDCRYCIKHKGCSIDDDMTEIYRYIEECDNVVIASPLYFSELTGRTLDVCSRFQTYYCASFFRKESTGIKPKRGGIILAGGGDGSYERAASTARILLHHMHCTEIADAAVSHSTNITPAIDDTNAHKAVKNLSAFLNRELKRTVRV